MPAIWTKPWGARRASRELELMVLQTLDTLGSLHGYGIADGLERFSLGGFHEDAAALYPALARLERRQLVTATWSISADVNRRARFYSITGPGRRHLATERTAWNGQSIAHTLLREHDKQSHELEIARQVQQRLFPHTHEAIAGVDYAGSCRPALHVGGDLYDFIQFSDTRLGIAIGDISGKGVGASLLMATLRAYMRGLLTVARADLPNLMRSLNRFVGESSFAERYATLFYAQYDASTRELCYVNAGHCPPLLFRAGGAVADALRLDTGGPVVGLLPKCDYEQGTVHLAPGDVLIGFTDGISEAANEADVEWGEQGIAAAVTRLREVPAHALVQQVMAKAVEHIASAAQRDDMTLVALRAV